MSEAPEVESASVAAEMPAKKEPLAKQILKQGVGIVLALGLVYWCFKGQDMGKLLQYAREADLKWVGMVFVSAIMSHLLRAWRWTVLLRPLSDKPISLWNSFCAVMYGYAVNLVVPRGGEVTRIVAISKSDNIPWAGVLPTMFIDRLLDLAMLVLLVGLTMAKLPPGILDPRLTGPTGILLCAATVFGLVALPFVGKIGRAVVGMEPVKKIIPEAIFPKIDQLLVQFDQGTRALTSATKLIAIAISSVVIWACYYMNMVFMNYAFHLEKAIDLSKGLAIFAISSVSVLIPTPGAVGGYHFFTSQALQKVAGIDEAQSLAYAALTHLLTFIVLAVGPAAVCFLIQWFRNKKA
jgi:uncharacterized protein (TIRG00374 family)